MDDMKTSDDVPQSASVSRRNFIKGVVAAGAVASSSAYLFRSATVHGQPSAAGAVERLVRGEVADVGGIKGLARPPLKAIALLARAAGDPGRAYKHV